MNISKEMLGKTCNKALFIGIFWKVSSCFCFAGVNGVVRYLSGGSQLKLIAPLPIYMIMFFQNFLGIMILLPIILNHKNNIKSFITTKYSFLHTVRITTAALGVGLWYVSLQYIPLTQAVALSFVSPFITIIGALIFLKEELNIHRTISIILSILGGFLIIRPDTRLQGASFMGLLAIFPLCATLIFAMDKVITRKLIMNGDSALTITLLFVIFTTPLCLIPTAYYGWQTPHINHLPWLFLIAIFGVGANFTFSKAFDYAEVTILMPFAITKIVFCGLIGYFFFAEFPKTLNMWVGIIIATISTVVLSFEKKSYKEINIENPAKEPA